MYRVNVGAAGEEHFRTALVKIVAAKRAQKREREGEQSEGNGRARKVHKTSAGLQTEIGLRDEADPAVAQSRLG